MRVPPPWGPPIGGLKGGLSDGRRYGRPKAKFESVPAWSRPGHHPLRAACTEVNGWNSLDSTGAIAPDTPDPNSLPKVSCSDFKYSAAFLAKYPKAPAACLEGRTYKGVNYAKFSAKVDKVRSSGVTLQLLHTAGTPITPLTIKPADQKAFILVNGKQTQITDLKWVSRYFCSISCWCASRTPGPGAVVRRLAPLR